MRKYQLIFWFYLGTLPSILAQHDSIPIEPSTLQETILEDFLQNTETETNFDFNTHFEHLETYASNPLDLNKATEADLKTLGLLSDPQIIQFLNYRTIAGTLISIYELQAIPNFDLASIRNLLPFVRVAEEAQTFKVPLKNMLLQGNNQLFMRWTRTLQTARGFDDEKNPFEGDPNRFYIRFKHSYSDRLSYGFTAEKDPGEAFFKGSNSKGFDFYSAHFFLRNYSKYLKALAIGDFAATFGQGLIMQSGFSTGKTAQTLMLKRQPRAIRPYTSVSENDFFRGIASTIAVLPDMELTSFISRKGRDANLNVLEVLENEGLQNIVTSLQTSGLHRTAAEIADKNANQQTTFGSNLKWQKKRGHLSLNALYIRLEKPLQRDLKPYNQFYFNGSTLLNLSLDYSYLFRNFNFFGETAYSDNGAIATLNGLLLAVDKKVDVGFVVRHFPRHFHSLHGDPFAETSGVRNETGAYLGLEIRPFKNWKWNGYFDMWRHPWLRFSVDAPSTGYEWLARLTWTRRRKFDIYVQVRQEVKEKNAKDNSTNLDFLAANNRFQTRLHLSYKLSKRVELRTRFDATSLKIDQQKQQTGFTMYQDILIRPKYIPLSIAARFAIFDTDSFDVRTYAYESDLLYAFSIPAYFSEGTRYYVKLRYTGIQNLLLEARYSQTDRSKMEAFGSGLDEINGQRKSEIRMQIRWTF